MIFAVLIFLITGSLMDTYSILRGFWKFSGKGLLGFKFGLMPIEEYIFMIVVPFWIITIYKLVENKNLKKKKK